MKVFVYGAGGHGKVVADCLSAAGRYDVRGFIDDDESRSGLTVTGLQIIGGLDQLRREAETKIGVALGVGDNARRQKCAALCMTLDIEILTVIHPAATVSKSADLQPGTVVMAGAVINPSAEIGAGVIVNTGAVIEHDVSIGDYAHVSPNAVMGGGSRLGSLAHLGLGAAVLPQVAVGNGTVIGAGAVVVRDIADNVVAFGVPARVHRKL